MTAQMAHRGDRQSPASAAASRIVAPGVHLALRGLHRYRKSSAWLFNFERRCAGQTLLHVPQRMHFSRSISCFSYGVIAMASAGQCWAQIVQPMQSSVIEYLIRALHLPAGQRPCRWASYSSRKYRSVESTGFGAVLPRPQRLPCLIILRQVLELVEVRRLALAGAQPVEDVQHPPRADPAERALAARLVLRELEEVAGDIDHAVGLVEHDQAAGAHDGPGLGQRLVVDRAGRPVVAGMQPPEGPPICTALNFSPPAMPPPISSTIWRIVMPIGTSISPPRAILPARAKTFVPLLLPVPMRGERLGAVAEDPRARSA